MAYIIAIPMVANNSWFCTSGRLQFQASLFFCCYGLQSHHSKCVIDQRSYNAFLSCAACCAAKPTGSG